MALIITFLMVVMDSFFKTAPDAATAGSGLIGSFYNALNVSVWSTSSAPPCCRPSASSSARCCPTTSRTCWSPMIGALAGTDHPAAGALITDRSGSTAGHWRSRRTCWGWSSSTTRRTGASPAGWWRSRPTRDRRTGRSPSRGRTPRNAVMFGAPGHLYVYLIYGLHLCANVVCGPGAKPEAVLLRAAEITVGRDLAQRRGAVPDVRLAAGPGNLGAAFGLDRSMDGADLLAGPIRLARGARVARIERTRASASTMRANGRHGRCASRSRMTRTAPDAELAAGAAADQATLRALEFGAIVGMLAELTAFGPSRELAEATQPVADATHVALLQDQTDEAVRLLDDQAQTTIGGARDVRAPVGRAGRGGRLTAPELLDVAETARAADLFATRLAGWTGAHLAELRASSWIPHRHCASGSSAASTRAARCSTRPPRSWRPCASGCGPPRTACASGSTPCCIPPTWPG